MIGSTTPTIVLTALKNKTTEEKIGAIVRRIMPRLGKLATVLAAGDKDFTIENLAAAPNPKARDLLTKKIMSTYDLAEKYHREIRVLNIVLMIILTKKDTTEEQRTTIAKICVEIFGAIKSLGFAHNQWLNILSTVTENIQGAKLCAQCNVAYRDGDIAKMYEAVAKEIAMPQIH